MPAPFISYVTELSLSRRSDKVKQQLITAAVTFTPGAQSHQSRRSELHCSLWFDDTTGAGCRPDVDDMSERRVADAPEHRLSSNASI